jgi:very-short-patch-repair endonuclease
MRGPETATTIRARALRRADNDAESALWNELRARRLNGYKFVRQLPVGPYFADFACRNHRLVVELDGSQHADNPYDRRRDAAMAQLGWSILRFWNADALRQMDGVLDTILAAIEGRLSEDVEASDMRYVRATATGDRSS